MNGVHRSLYTLAEGVPLPRNDTSVQILNSQGGGLVLLQDTQLIETLAHFSRERIPERVVHAKAAGAGGYFEVTHDISDITDADFLNGVGKKTELITRISTVGPERGSADTVRDFHGWAIKLKTKEGNNDWVFNNRPSSALATDCRPQANLSQNLFFFIRDPIKFPSVNRSHKRHPVTNAADADMFWDFHTHNPESIHALMFLFGDRGIPASLRNINGYGNHTYKWTKKEGSFHYVKIHIHADGGIKYLSSEKANKLAGTHPDAHVLDLFDSISNGAYPSYTVSIQAIRPEEVSQCPVNIFDMTKVWPKSQYPLRPIGKIVLNRNPSNYFTDIEQAAFSPSNMVPGIEPSADPMLQARMFAYPDAARYRLGTNYQFLPTNQPIVPVHTPTQRDGSMNFTSNYGGDPNYVGAEIKKTEFKKDVQVADWKPAKENFTGPVTFASEVTEADFEQPRALWTNVMARQKGCQERFVENVAEHVSQVKREWLREEVYSLFARVDKKLGQRVADKVEGILAAREEPHPDEDVNALARHFSHIR